MPQVCKVCTHEDRPEIERAIVERTGTLTVIASRYDVSDASLRRHRDNHLPQIRARAEAREADAVDAVAEAAESERVRLDDLLLRVRRLADEAEKILRETDNPTTALRANREARESLKLLAQMVGELQDGVQVNVLVNPVWLHMKTVIKAALDPYPEARRAVFRALEADD
jgi:transposase-like protein